jgi:hypothetical protein
MLGVRLGTLGGAICVNSLTAFTGRSSSILTEALDAKRINARR